MLVQVRIENHRSLRDAQTLSLVATGGNPTAGLLHAEGLDQAVVPVVAIYGANASGKSNVLDALEFFTHAVTDSQRRWDVDGTPHDPFRLSAKAKAPSRYEVDVVLDGVRFRYGFELGATRVEQEWLHAWPRGRRATWFDRKGDRFTFGKTLGGENAAIRSLTRRNSLFLSAAAQSNHPALTPLARYFANWEFAPKRGRWDSPEASGERFARLIEALDKPDDQAAILHLLQAADTGITGITTHDPGADGERARVFSIWLRHRSDDPGYAWLPLAAQSAGTIALLNFAPQILDALRTGAVLCIDELESSLHPLLAWSVVRLFGDRAHNPNGAQLVFATHDTNLLGSLTGDPVLRRDQIWFTEKHDSGATTLYPLTDFHPRKDENLERGYLQGRYGAVPFLRELLTPPKKPRPKKRGKAA